MIICNPQSFDVSWGLLVTLEQYMYRLLRVTVKIHSMIESTSWYEFNDILCHLKELIHNIKAYATYNQITWQITYPDNLLHIKLMMYPESYWLL